MPKHILLIALIFPLQSLASELYVTITDAEKKPVPFAVVELVNENYPAKPASEAAQVIQQDLNFQPFVSIVTQGTFVEFPNMDKTRHHVYSFSPAKVFELRLYSGEPEAPVMFDRAGIVTLGCNIHDNMLAYVYVSGSHFTTMTNASGVAHFNNLPQHEFEIRVWHPWQQAPLSPLFISVKAGTEHLDRVLDIQWQDLPAANKAGFGDY
ncbi:methylamine utilization protein [Arsukibacterium sp.]|uniref:methylamine utilization protein n=1 Tax=Arsukibacterium sp. TaxID=1977258 RepID=UPI00299D9B7F|nr:methylamine utilization protein [Arsukibacterium sp.]MDX1677949.1 methylamine utilization protein [Arsukibacterium sp.]